MHTNLPLRRLLLYALMGGVGTLAQYATLVGLVSLHAATPVVGSMIGALVGAVVNFFLNARVTFRTSRRSSLAFVKFGVTALLGIGVNGLAMKLMTEELKLNYLLSQIVSTGLIFGLTFFINSKWTFREAHHVSNLDA